MEVGCVVAADQKWLVLVATSEDLNSGRTSKSLRYNCWERAVVVVVAGAVVVDLVAPTSVFNWGCPTAPTSCIALLSSAIRVVLDTIEPHLSDNEEGVGDDVVLVFTSSSALTTYAPAPCFATWTQDDDDDCDAWDKAVDDDDDDKEVVGGPC